MTQTFRSIVIGTCCIAAAWALNGCSSEDAGQTLSVKLDSNYALVMSRATAGTFDNPATTTVDESTPDSYEGTSSIVAKIVYRGKKSLVYRWSFSVPTNIELTPDVQSGTVEIKAQGKTPHAVPLASGRGVVTLEVYESDGSQSQSASCNLDVIVGFSG